MTSPTLEILSIYLQRRGWPCEASAARIHSEVVRGHVEHDVPARPAEVERGRDDFARRAGHDKGERG